MRRVLGGGLGQPHELEQFGHSGRGLGPGQPAADQAVAHIGCNIQVWKQRVRLENNTEITLRGRQIGDVSPALKDAPRSLQIQAGDGAQKGGFTATRGAQKANEFAGHDIQRDVFERREIPELLSELLDAQVGLNRHYLGADLPS